MASDVKQPAPIAKPYSTASSISIKTYNASFQYPKWPGTCCKYDLTIETLVMAVVIMIHDLKAWAKLVCCRCTLPQDTLQVPF